MRLMHNMVYSSVTDDVNVDVRSHFYLLSDFTTNILSTCCKSCFFIAQIFMQQLSIITQETMKFPAQFDHHGTPLSTSYRYHLESHGVHGGR